MAVLEQMSRLTQTNDTAQLRIIVASERHTFLSSSGRGFWANGRGKRYLELEQSFQGAGERSSDFCFWSSSIHLFSALLSLRRSEKVLSYAGEKNTNWDLAHPAIYNTYLGCHELVAIIWRQATLSGSCPCILPPQVLMLHVRSCGKTVQVTTKGM